MRIATVSVRTGFAMTGFLQGVQWDGGTHGSRPTRHFFVGADDRPCPPGSARSLWCVGAGGACSYGVDRVPVGDNDETSAAVMRLGSSI